MPSSLNVGRTVERERVGGEITVLAGGRITFAADGRLRLTPQANPPANGVEGEIYMDTDHKLYVHNGTTWVVVGTQT